MQYFGRIYKKYKSNFKNTCRNTAWVQHLHLIKTKTDKKMTQIKQLSIYYAIYSISFNNIH